MQHSQGKMYEDDGLSSNAIKDKAYTLMSFNAKNNRQALTFSLKTTGNGYVDMPEKRALKITIHNWSKQPNSIEANGQKIAEYNRDKANNTLTFDTSWQMQAMTIKINKYKKD